MDEGAQAAQAAGQEGHGAEPRHHPKAWRRAPGRKAGPAPDGTDYGARLAGVVRHVFPDLNRWLVEMLRSSLAFVPIPPKIPPVGQLRFHNSS